jgi:hypothetical protein
LEGECGYFERRRDWHIANPQQGVIIQEITRHFAVEQYVAGQNGAPDTWAPLQGTDIDTYITSRSSNAYATVTRYWELWQVDANGNVSDDGDDTFSLCSVIPDRKRKNTTRGTYTMTGNAVFYATTLTPQGLGFARDAVAPAGGLFSTLANPASAISANGLVAAGQPVQYTTTVRWDSSTQDRYSQVTET